MMAQLKMLALMATQSYTCDKMSQGYTHTAECMWNWRALNELSGYQRQFPGFDVVIESHKMLPLEETA